MAENASYTDNYGSEVTSMRGSVATTSITSLRRRHVHLPLDVDSQYKIAKKKELIVKKLEQLRLNNDGKDV